MSNTGNKPSCLLCDNIEQLTVANSSPTSGGQRPKVFIRNTRCRHRHAIQKKNPTFFCFSVLFYFFCGPFSLLNVFRSAGALVAQPGWLASRAYQWALAGRCWACAKRSPAKRRLVAAARIDPCQRQLQQRVSARCAANAGTPIPLWKATLRVAASNRVP